MEHKDKAEAAKRLISDKAIMELLTEYLLEVEEKLTPQAIEGMSNEQVGAVYRADITAESKIRERFARIKNLTLTSGKPNPAAKE